MEARLAVKRKLMIHPLANIERSDWLSVKRQIVPLPNFFIAGLQCSDVLNDGFSKLLSLAALAHKNYRLLFSREFALLQSLVFQRPYSST